MAQSEVVKWSRRRALGAVAALTGAALPGQTKAATAPRLPIRLVVLDIGGTIVEERGDIPEALGAAFAKKGISISRSEINQWRGASKREIVRHFVTERLKRPGAERDKLIETVYTDFQQRIIESYATIKGIPGAEDALRAMRNMGVTLATSTGFDATITASIMSRLGWRDYFVAQITSDDVAQGRPSPYMLFHAMEKARVDGVAQVVAVGDTPLDLRAAANGGMAGIVGVLSGVGTRETMEPEPHTDIIDSVATLPALLRSKYT
ncbi:MAG TPA: HAD-IA family hydrolase [Bryobacteraceae bacterium]|nr:HAD-IA family hydrolase [Bryobacteraceae bacterium]